MKRKKLLDFHFDDLSSHSKAFFINENITKNLRLRQKR